MCKPNRDFTIIENNSKNIFKLNKNKLALDMLEQVYEKAINRCKGKIIMKKHKVIIMS